MNSTDAVDVLLKLASAAHNHPVSSLDQPSNDSLVLHIVAIRALLQGIEAKSSSEQDIAAFCRLTCVPSIRLLIECRQHTALASLESWPHLLLFELSSFCSRLIGLSKHSNIPKTSVDGIIANVHLHACAQLPVLWDSFLVSPTRQDTSPLARLMISRLLYLSIVVQPKYAANINDIYTRTLASQLSSTSVVQIESLLQSSPFFPGEEAMVITLGISAAVNLSAFRSERDAYWLRRSRHCLVTLELMSWVYEITKTNRILQYSIYEWSPVATWLFSLCDFVKYLDSSETIYYMMSDWLLYADNQSNGWIDLLVPMLLAYPEEVLCSLEETLNVATRWEGRVDTRLIGILMRCFLFLASTNCTISRDCWTNRRQGREVFLVLFFLYNDEVQMQYDIIEYLFSLDSLVGEDQQYQAMASVSGSPREGTVHAFKWWQTVAVEAILHLESYMDKEQPNNILSIEALIVLLIYILRHFLPCSEVSQKLRGAIRQLMQRIFASPMHEVPWNLCQNALTICSCMSWPYESPLVGSLPIHLDFAAETRPLSQNGILLLTEHLQLLALTGLLSKCTNDQVVAACYVLFDEIILSFQVGIDYNSRGAHARVSWVCSALISLLESSSLEAADLIGSSPWSFTIRLTLERIAQSPELASFDELRMKISGILANLGFCAAGTAQERPRQANKKILKIKRNEAGIVVNFME